MKSKRAEITRNRLDANVPGLLDIAMSTDGRANANTRGAVVSVLRGMEGAEATAALSKILDAERDPEVTTMALVALSKRGDELAEPAVRRAAKNDEYQVRRAVAKALQSVGTHDSIPTLVQLASDEDRGVRIRAVDAFGMVGGGGEVLDALSIAVRDETSVVRRCAAEALSSIGGTQALQLLRHQAAKEGFFNRATFKQAISAAEERDN